MTGIKTRSALKSLTDTNLPSGIGGITAANHRDLEYGIADSAVLVGEAEVRVVNMTTTSPPGSPADRDAYVIASGASGAWAGRSSQIAIWDGSVSPSVWVYYEPVDGQAVWNMADDTQYRWGGSTSPSTWVAQGGSTLSGLSDTTISSPSNGQFLKYNGSVWVNATAATGALVILGGVRLSKSGDQTLTTASTTDVTWDTESFDPLSVHTGSAATVVVPSGCSHAMASAGILFASNATGFREVLIEFSGGGEGPGLSTNPVSGTAHKIQLGSGMVAVSPSDTIKVTALQNSGGNLNITASARTYFSVIFYGAP